MTTTSSSFEERLCLLVRNYPWLYDCTTPEHKNKITVQGSWGQIAEVLNSDAITVERKWRNVRDRFTRKLKKYNLSKRSGAGASLADVPLILTDLAWLKTYISHRDTSTNFPVSGDMAHSDEEDSSSLGASESLSLGEHSLISQPGTPTASSSPTRSSQQTPARPYPSGQHRASRPGTPTLAASRSLTYSRMSKLESLNACVTNLLTVAVHEVLDMVKQTVSEYQQKTVRTQRENDSLKRRLQELQDQLKEASEGNKCTPLPPSLCKTRQDEPIQGDLKQEQRLKNSQGHDPNLTETKSKTLQMEPFNSGELNCTATTHAHAVKFSTTAALVEQGEHDTISNVTNAALTVYTSHSLELDNEQYNSVGRVKLIKMSGNLMSPPSLPMIKTEYEPLPYSASHEHLEQNQLFMCGDSESGTVQNAGMPESMTDNTETPGMVHYINTDGSSTFADSFQFECHSELAQGIKKPRKRLESHSCNICGKTFNRIGNLKIHQRCHTGEKPYCCLHCGRRFNHVGNLRKHKRIHTGERPYGCQQCGKTFSQAGHLKTHQKLHMDRRSTVQ